MKSQKTAYQHCFSFFLLLLSLLIVNSCASPSHTVVTDYPWNNEWKLVWSEEFDTEALAETNWTAVSTGLNWNNEDQAFLPQNIRTSKGTLLIDCKREQWSGVSNRVDDPTRWVTRDYTSGRIDTRHKKFWLYGRFEARIKALQGKGLLTAFWMISESDAWPPEIDIMEVLGEQLHTAYHTVHWGTQQNVQRDSGTSSHNADLSQDFHNYAVEWEPGIIRWFVDGIECYRTTKSIPSAPMYLILCPAMGPDWTGDMDETTPLPQSMECEWVKVWQR